MVMIYLDLQKIQSDGSFRCSFVMIYGNEDYAFTVNRVVGKVSGDTLTIQNSSHTVLYNAFNFKGNAAAMGSDAITICSIMCLCVK